MLKAVYGKAILYGYYHLDAVCEQIQDGVEKKALSSMSDVSPAIVQCERVATLKMQIDVLTGLKNAVKCLLKRFTQEQLKLLDYKYFKKINREEYADFDTTSRGYFRKQTTVLNKFCNLLSASGIDDEWFEELCLKVNFFRGLVKNIQIYDMAKNPHKSKGKPKNDLTTPKPTRERRQISTVQEVKIVEVGKA